MERRVLVVEDNPELSLGLADALNELGYGIDVAQDGVEALEYMQQHQPVAVVLDLILPRMGGVELLRIRRTNPTLARIPVIVLSGDRDSLEQARGLDAEVVLEKPVHLLILIDAIQRVESADSEPAGPTPGQPPAAPRSL